MKLSRTDSHCFFVCGYAALGYCKLFMITTNRLVENLDPRAKIVSFLAIILCIILTPITRYKDFQLYFLLILSLTFFSGTTVGQVFKRACVLIPFILAMALFVPFLKEGQVWGYLSVGYWKFAVTYEGAWMFLNVMVKSSLSILLFVLASSTTTFPDFLKGLDMLRAPRLLIMLTSFMYRYIFVLIEEARRLIRARAMRYFGLRYKEQFFVVGYMVGGLFIRTFERAERIYSAMVLRGFSGEIPCVKRFKLSYKDFLFTAAIFILLSGIVSGLIYKIGCIKVSDARVWIGL